VDVEVEDIAAELWVEQLGSGRGGVAGRARQRAAELAENEGGEMWSAGGVNDASEASRWCVATCGCDPS